jgi:mono/diheme cytochrome c family protein
MMATRISRIAGVAAGLCLAAAALAADDVSSRAFSVLKNNCFACHGAARTSGLDLRTASTATAGGQHGPSFVASKPDESRLYRMASHAIEPSMPPGKKLSDADLATLREWIASGASFAGFEEPAAPKQEERVITPEERAYWAFQPPKRVAPPGGAANPIDAFLLSAMRAKGLKASPKADRRSLIRRAYLDVTGLPPTPEEIETFVKDTSPDSWPKLVEKLLASPHYGERWARHWLDLVRYADSEGFEFDRDKPDAWRYRDYVVKAFNDDKPYDRFIKEQLAGDEFERTPEDMIATGYLRLGPSAGGGERGRQESLDDVITTTSMTFLGLTVGCARCHDHKFDPIPQKDYYRIQAVFSSTRPLSFPLVPQNEVDANKAATDKITQLERPLRRDKTALEAQYRKRLMDEIIAQLPDYMQAAWRTPAAERTEGQKLNVQQIERTLTNDTLAHQITDPQIMALMPEAERRKDEELTAQLAALAKQKPEPFAAAMAMTDSGRTAQPSYLLLRGAIDARGPQMSPGVLSVVAAKGYDFPAPPEGAQSTWRRRGFAEWVASPGNPLTARVMVNRLWQHHFGEGIVRTPSNFGKMGERPSHPELLDWLATEFIARGWSVKAMQRMMLLSDAYQMSSIDNAASVAIDPENRYFWRMPRERMEAEALRDQILAVSGKLDRTLGGPNIFPYISPDLFQSSTQRTWPGKSDEDPSTWRRSIYVYSKRSIRYPMFEAYDQPNLVNTCDRRNRSTIAPQALLLMNNNFVFVQSKYFAERLRADAGADPNAQVTRAFELALGRAPSASEKTAASAYIRSGADRLPEFCRALFNLNEFVYRP